MAENVYNVVELIGTSTESWEKAAKAAVERAGKSLRGLQEIGWVISGDHSGR
jgi:dodecin